MSMHDTSAGPSQLGRLILVRLLAHGKPPVKSDISSALTRLYTERVALGPAAWRELLDKTLADLRAGGWITIPSHSS